MMKMIPALAVIILINLFNYCDAQISIWDGTATIWTQGNGSESNPFLISSAQNLAYLANSVNNGETYSGVYFRLTTDIDLRSLPWQPIGGAVNASSVPIRFFKGHFEGHNHLVDNLSVTGKRCGLFGAVGESTILHLRVRGTVHANETECCAALLAAVVYNTTDSLPTRFIHCSTDGEVTASNSTSSYSTFSNAGGLVGMVWKCPYLTISNCSNNATVSTLSGGQQYAGGLVACFANDASCAFNIRNCHNTGNITIAGNNSGMGGVIGRIYLKNSEIDSSVVINCSNQGHLSTSSSSGVKGGGIIGLVNAYASGHGFFLIEKCCNTGNISLNETHAGGIVALLPVTSYYDMRVKNCYNTGTVSASYTGGVVATAGNVSSNTIHIDNCYNAGTVSGGSHRGGIVASGAPVITNCYYLNTCGGTNSNGTSLADSVMKGNTFPDMLNSDTIVFVLSPNLVVNRGYPIFGNSNPITMTVAADSLTPTSACLHGYCSILPDTAGFQYKSITDSSFTTLIVTPNTVFNQTIQNLQFGTEYVFRAFTKTGGVLYYGQMETFQTQPCDSLEVHIVSSVTEICDGEAATISANVITTNTSSLQFEWNTGETTESIVVTDSQPRVLTVSDNNGCFASDTFLLTVWPTATYDTVVNTSDSCFPWNDVLYCTSGDYIKHLQTEHGCDSTLTLHLTVLVSVPTHDFSNNYLLYPNPTSGSCILTCKNDDNEERANYVQLMDISGRIIQEIPWTGKDLSIDFSKYPAGMYMLRILQDERIVNVQKVWRIH